MKTLFPTLAMLGLGLAAAPAIAHEAGAIAHIHPHGSEALIIAALVVATVLAAMRYLRR